MLQRITDAFPAPGRLAAPLRPNFLCVSRLVVPDHKEIRRGTLRVIIRQAGLTVQEFLDLL